MTRWKRSLTFMLCAVLLFSMTACTDVPTPIEPSDSTVPETTAPAKPDGAKLFADARAAVDEAENLTLKVTLKDSSTVGASTYTSTSKQTLKLSDLNTDSFKASLEESLEIMGETTEFEEYFESSTLYVTVDDDYAFQGSMSAEEFTDRMVPAVLLDAALYGSITAEENASGTVITFTQPNGAEAWCMPEPAELTEATGTAQLNKDGQLISTTYNISYILGGITVSQSFKCDITIESALSLKVPSEKHAELSYIMAPRLIETATSYMECSGSVTTTISEAIISQAAGCVLTTQKSVDYRGGGSAHMAKYDYTHTFQDTSGTQSFTQTEKFLKGKYTMTIDDGKPEENSDVTASMMRSYCQDFLMENTLSLDYLENAQMTEFGGILYLELDCSEKYAKSLEDYCCSILFDDKDLLDGMATSYKTNSSEYYLAVNAFTGFPTAIGISYTGTHTIQGTTYTLTLQTDQAITLSSLSAYETITGEPAPQKEPDEKATPLFYKVSGPNGQQMWLLGTIHVGDSRTSYLPKEIYNALDASDALALEYDSKAFDEAIEEDEKLAQTVSGYYFYTDGSTTAKHIDAALYEKALKLLKASGNHNINASYLKPVVWSNSIDNFFQKQLYQLSPDQGVDSLLAHYARSANIEIREIESGQFQLKMLTGYSDALQEMLLEASMEGHIIGSPAATFELFELWCKGDEDALRKAIADDTSDMTEEEKKLYEEYNKAMSTDRNKTMLDVAKSYLESGETVFYAVGLAHLLAEDGLVNTLRDAGYTVELIDLK